MKFILTMIILTLMLSCTRRGKLEYFKSMGYVPESCNCSVVNDTSKYHITTDSCVTNLKIYKENVTWYDIGKQKDEERMERFEAERRNNNSNDDYNNSPNFMTPGKKYTDPLGYLFSPF